MLETSILKKVIFGSIKPPTETTCDPDTFFPLCKLKSKSIQQENSSIYCPKKKKKKSNKAIFTSYHETFLLGGGRGGKPISPPTRHPQRRWISGGVTQPPQARQPKAIRRDLPGVSPPGCLPLCQSPGYPAVPGETVGVWLPLPGSYRHSCAACHRSHLAQPPRAHPGASPVSRGPPLSPAPAKALAGVCGFLTAEELPQLPTLSHRPASLRPLPPPRLARARLFLADRNSSRDNRARQGPRDKFPFRKSSSPSPRGGQPGHLYLVWTPVLLPLHLQPCRQGSGDEVM